MANEELTAFIDSLIRWGTDRTSDAVGTIRMIDDSFGFDNAEPAVIREAILEKASRFGGFTRGEELGGDRVRMVAEVFDVRNQVAYVATLEGKRKWGLLVRPIKFQGGWHANAGGVAGRRLFDERGEGIVMVELDMARVTVMAEGTSAEHRNHRTWLVRLGAPLAAASLILSVSGCSSADEKGYDISPIFPLSADKCAEYNGDESGEGFGASCMVTKADCGRAAADWRATMAEGGVTDAIQFSCD